MMNQEDLFKKIGLILSELQDQYQFLAQNPQNLNELELELFLANANFLTDHVQIVKKVNGHAPVKEIAEHSSATDLSVPELSAHETVAEQTEPEAISEEPLAIDAVQEDGAAVHEEEKTEPAAPVSKPLLNEEIFKLDQEPASFEFILNDHPGSDKFEFEEKEVGEIFDRPLSEEEERIIAQKQKLKGQKAQEATRAEEEDEIGPEPFLVGSAEEEIEAPAHIPEPVVHQRDLFKEEKAQEKPVIEERPAANASSIPEAPVKPTLNELLGGTQRMESKRTEVTDLKQAISLNDKLLYIKELFNGYNLAYAEVIDLLNKMPDFKTADTFLQNNYAVKNDWKSKQNTVDQFYELLNRRFPAK